MELVFQQVVPEVILSEKDPPRIHSEVSAFKALNVTKDRKFIVDCDFLF